MKFQGRGKVYLSPRDEDGNTGLATLEICTDALSLALNEETFSHFNKCGAVDVEDFRGTKTQGAEITMTVADIADEAIMALGMNGTVDEAASTGSVSDEALPSGIVVGDSYFLGGNDSNQGIAGLVIADDAAGTLTEGTNYTVNVDTGRVEFTDLGSFVQLFSASYSFTHGAQVSFFTNPSQEYALRYDFINKANNNRPGLVDIYRVRMGLFDNFDLQPDELSIPTMKGSALADPNRDDTDRLGRFGRVLL